jgi:hypothetical protein
LCNGSAREGSARHQSKDTDVDELTKLLSQAELVADEDSDMPDFNSVAEEDVWAAVEEWIDMEENPEVVLIELENEAEAEDLLEEHSERVAALAEAATAMSDDEQAGPAPAEPEEESVSAEDVKDVMGTIDALDHLFNGFRSLFPET